MKRALMVCWVGLLAVPFCVGSVRGRSLVIPAPRQTAARPAARVRPARPAAQRSARLRTKVRPRRDEPIVVILYGDPGSWM